MPIAVGDAFPDDLTKTKTVDMGRWGTSEVTYYPGRLTLATLGEDDEDDAPLDDGAPSELARDICDMVAAWDFEGPLKKSKGHDRGAELVPRGQVIPLDPEIVQHVNPQLLWALSQGIVRAEVPKPKTRR